MKNLCKVYFYDMKGVEYPDMRFGLNDELLVAQHYVHNLRILDVITNF